MALELQMAKSSCSGWLFLVVAILFKAVQLPVLSRGFLIKPLSTKVVGQKLRPQSCGCSGNLKMSKAMSVINSIKVPKHMIGQAVACNAYVDYFKQQPGFVSSSFYQASDNESTFSYVNVVVWESQRHVNDVVNAGFENSEGMNRDGFLKVLGKGFPPPIEVFTVIEHDL